jgi:hypothetical protein
MNPSMKKLFGAALAVGLAVVQSPAQTGLNISGLPLQFEANQGQAEATASFIAHGQSSEFLISATSAQFVLRKASGETVAARMQIVGANPSASISGHSELPGKINYLLGNNPALWRVGVPTFAQVRVENVYPGVNVVYYGNGRQLEYDFDLAAGIAPQTITLRFDGAEKISVNPQGELVVSLNGGDIIQHPPVVYQNVGATRREISGRYKLLDAHTATFALGSYDHSLPLVIDPILGYSTYFGGNKGDTAYAIAVDTNGCAYIAGGTLSTTFTNGAYQASFQGGTVAGDAFVAKFDKTGSNLVYFTYLGGNSEDTALGITVDNSGNAYITGMTCSPNFPTNHPLYGQITSKYVSSKNGSFYAPDAFVSELNTNGTNLVYSTYLGGSYYNIGNAIYVDAEHNAYVVGWTTSTNFPVTTNALQNKLQCTNSVDINCNAFITEISTNGTNLLYSSYLGGNNYDDATSITVDTSNFIYVAGFTASTTFPKTNILYPNALSGFKYLNGATNANATAAYDAFVCKFAPNFTNWVYSTYLGGTNNDEATGIAADSNGNAYVVGWTVSTNFPGIFTNYPGSCAGFVKNYMTNDLVNASTATTNAFLTEISSDGSNILHTAVFGGLQMDVGNGVALDATGNIFVVGTASSTNFPVTPASLLGSLRTTNSGYSDVFVTAFKADWSALLYSTYLGGYANDFGNAIAVDNAGNAYITGYTFSTNYPSFNAFQPALNGTSAGNNTSDAFLTKILPATPTPVLTASAAGTNVWVSWPPLGQESPAYFGLETTPNLSATSVWTVVTNAPETNSAGYAYKLNPTNGAQFFRLNKH